MRVSRACEQGMKQQGMKQHETARQEILAHQSLAESACRVVSHLAPLTVEETELSLSQLRRQSNNLIANQSTRQSSATTQSCRRCRCRCSLKLNGKFQRCVSDHV
jgi:alanine racemase